MKSKIETYIGFSIRAGKYKCGANAIDTLRRAELLILCASGAKNAVHECERLMKKFHCRAVLAKGKTVEELTGKENCKLLAITDKSLAGAILDHLDEEFTEFKWEAK